MTGYYKQQRKSDARRLRAIERMQRRLEMIGSDERECELRPNSAAYQRKLFALKDERIRLWLEIESAMRNCK